MKASKSHFFDNYFFIIPDHCFTFLKSDEVNRRAGFQVSKDTGDLFIVQVTKIIFSN